MHTPFQSQSAKTHSISGRQNLPGLDQKMDPLAEHVLVEKWDNNGKPYLEEYKGTGKLAGKSAIVTGGDSGIGRSVALFFARESANVTINYLPEEQEDAEKVAELVKAAPMGTKELHLVPGDLRDPNFCKSLIDSHVAKWKSLDVLVHNASKQISVKDIADIDIANVESTFQSNIVAAFSLSKHAVPHMKRGSSIIVSGSVTGFKGSADKLDYASTKGALHSFSRSLAQQLAPKGIRVNGVAPGPVYTPLQPASQSAEKMDGWAVGVEPLHGRPGQPAELGPSYVFLADSGASNLITGSTLHINAGVWMGA